MKPEQEQLALRILSQLYKGAVSRQVLVDGSTLIVCQFCKTAAEKDGYTVRHTPDCIYHLSKQLGQTLPSEKE